MEIKHIWSPEPDKGKSLTLGQIKKHQATYKELKGKLKDLFNLSDEIEGFKLKFIPKQIPTNFNVFDSRRVLIKMQNPLKPSEILSVMNVLDPDLAIKLRKTFFNLWNYESNII